MEFFNQKMEASHRLFFPPKLVFLIFVSVFLLYSLLGGFLQVQYQEWGIYLSQVLFLFFPILFLLKVRSQKIENLECWKFPSLKILGGFLVGMFFLAFSIHFLANYQNRFLPLPLETEELLKNLTYAPSVMKKILKILVLVFSPAFFEELFFRGLLQNSWQQMGPWRGVLLASFVFALVHGNLVYFHFYFILGLFLGITYWKSASLWTSIAAHALNNAITLMLVWWV